MAKATRTGDSTRESSRHDGRNDGGRRDEIVAQAVALFDAKGYAGTSVSDIAEAVGLSKPALYHWIEHKEDVLFWIHEDVSRMLIENAESRLALERPAAEQLRGITRDLLSLMDTHRDYLRVFFEHFRELEPQRQAKITARRAEYQALVQGLVERGMATGEFRPQEPAIITNAFFGMCIWAYQWYKADGPLSNEQVADTIFDLLLGGLEAR